MYKVIKYFIDLADGNHEYRVGDVFPRVGAKVSAERLMELSTSRNKRGEPMITEIGVEKSEEVKEEAEESLSDMTKNELLAYAKKHKVKGVDQSMTKAAIIAKIEG